MRILLALGTIFLLSNFCIAQPKIDVLRYQFLLILKDNKDTIKALASITFINKTSSQEVTFDLASRNSNGKGMIVDSVSQVNRKNFDEIRIGSEHANDKLIVNLSNSHQSDTQLIRIYYRGVPSDGLIISQNQYGDRTFFADNWPNRAHYWLPCNDDPADKASCEFTITAPPQYSVISNGEMMMAEVIPYKDGNFKTSVWIEDIPLPTKVMVIGVAKFAVKTYDDSPKNIPITAWTFPQDSAKGFKNYSYASEILKFYSSYVGPYPYEKLANVQSKTIFGGMENASCIFYFEGSASSNSSVEDLLAHEIAHQWFGDMVTEKKYSHLWLSEGFASYFTDLYFESKYGKDSANFRLKKERSDVINFNNGQPVVDSVSKGMNLLNANSYQKGAWVLHMLRKQVGDSTFHLIIKNYYDEYKGKNADTEDFENVVESVTKKDFKQFFKQWLYTPGIPQLNVKWNYDQSSKQIQITIDQDQKQREFQFPLQILMQFSDGKSQITTVDIKARHEVFNIPITGNISNIQVDPNTSLLFEGKIQKIK